MLQFYNHTSLVQARVTLSTEALREDQQLSNRASWGKNLNRILNLFGLALPARKPSDQFIEKVMSTMKTKYIDYGK